jgi:3-oxoacyl-[acyl-carrier-protein] synthase II
VISIDGIGWVNRNEYGCVRQGRRLQYKDSTRFNALLRKRIFSCPFEKFGRLDNISKMTCYAVALALKDAGIRYSRNRKQDIGIIGTNASGSLQSDIRYFMDYLECGRKLSRGNLFIYTLPSSPLGEAAIHFGLQGPLLYVTSTGNSLPSVMAMASDMILLDETSAMLAGMAEEEEAVYFFLMKKSDFRENCLSDVARVSAIVSKSVRFSQMIEGFDLLKEGYPE